MDLQIWFIQMRCYCSHIITHIIIYFVRLQQAPSVEPIGPSHLSEYNLLLLKSSAIPEASALPLPTQALLFQHNSGSPPAVLLFYMQSCIEMYCQFAQLVWHNLHNQQTHLLLWHTMLRRHTGTFVLSSIPPIQVSSTPHAQRCLRPISYPVSHPPVPVSSIEYPTCTGASVVLSSIIHPSLPLHHHAHHSSELMNFSF